MRGVRAVDRQDALLKRYLGDGVYAAFDGFSVWLTAEDGRTATDTICLEPAVLAALASFSREAWETRKRISADGM